MTADTSLRSIRGVADDEDEDEDGDNVEAEEEEEDVEEEVLTPMGSLTSTLTPLRGEAFLLRT